MKTEEGTKRRKDEGEEKNGKSKVSDAVFEVNGRDR
jgi:hypothetical protein